MNTANSSIATPPDGGRRMVAAVLLGAHTHQSLCGVSVHVWLRNGVYIARGRYQGRAFGESLGSRPTEAAARLRGILSRIESGAYARPTEARRRAVSPAATPRLTLRQLVSEYIREKRRLLGRRTAGDYKSRLGPVLDYAELPDSVRRWPWAGDVDREFAVGLKAFLHQATTTRNGKPGGAPKCFSARQVVNILECLRGVLAWGRRADVRRLPVTWANPFDAELIGTPPRKDPLREDKLPLATRIELARRLDPWQLAHLGLLMVLPLRPDDLAGVVITDVDFGRGWVAVGDRLDGNDFSKGRVAYKLPFPTQLAPLLRACIGRRAEGPLFRSRSAWAGRHRPPAVATPQALQSLYQDLLRSQGAEVQAAQDRKSVFRKLLRSLGGGSTDQLAAEFKAVLRAAGVRNGATLYALRHATTTAMYRAGVGQLDLRYLTGHTTRDVLAEYTTLDPIAAMGPYFTASAPLLEVIALRAREYGFPNL